LAPFFSIILPTYNRAALLPNAIRSVIGQTFSTWELLIVDDGSIVHTEDILSKFTQDDKRIFKYTLSHRGHIRAKNYAIDLANGRYITFLDSDDTYKPEHLEIYYSYLKNEDIDLLYSTPEIIGNEYVPDINNPSEMVHISQCKVGGTFAVKSKIIKKAKGFPLVNYGEDTLFFTNLKNMNTNIVKSDFSSYIYNRTQNDSITKKII